VRMGNGAVGDSFMGPTTPSPRHWRSGSLASSATGSGEYYIGFGLEGKVSQNPDAEGWGTFKRQWKIWENVLFNVSAYWLHSFYLMLQLPIPLI
jgi:hypothetical protein